MVTYSSDAAMSQYDNGTTATFQCDSGYELTGGDTVRTCTGNGSSPVGQWIGTAPVCTGKDKNTFFVFTTGAVSLCLMYSFSYLP